MNALELNDVWLSFRGRPVLEGINLNIPEGELVGLIGPNGGGKTVLLKVILGLLTPDRGTVQVLGRSARKARGMVGYVPQHLVFDREFPIATLDVVLMGRLGRRRLWRPYDRDDRDAARQALKQVDALELADRPIGKLSGGELQRILVARALVTNPRLLLLDEPTSSLDPAGGRGLYGLLQDLSSRMTVILVSHDIGVIAQHVESVACLDHRLHYHPSGDITRETIEATYGCPVDFIVHEHTHRVLGCHESDQSETP
jgi:zinc transport system ATP-binding protein